MRLAKTITRPLFWLYARLYPVSYARLLGVKMGVNVRIYGSSLQMFSAEPFLVTLGDNVYITHATFLCHDGGVLPLRKTHPDLDITAPITVGSNCFIGYGAI